MSNNFEIVSKEKWALKNKHYLNSWMIQKYFLYNKIKFLLYFKEVFICSSNFRVNKNIFLLPGILENIYRQILMDDSQSWFTNK